jgi:hypothetical protein
MVSFEVAEWGREPLRFSVGCGGALVAGSRRMELSSLVCRSLVGGLGEAGFGFLVGCAGGVDKSFRRALAESPYADLTLVGCAFRSRVHALSTYGLPALWVVPPGLSPKAALRRRTLWLAKRCVMAVVFPLDPTTGAWGAGSRLAYRACLEQLKPVFVVCPEAPREAECYRVVRSCLYGVEGYWVVPHPVRAGGPCDDEF